MHNMYIVHHHRHHSNIFIIVITVITVIIFFIVIIVMMKKSLEEHVLYPLAESRKLRNHLDIKPIKFELLDDNRFVEWQDNKLRDR